MFGLVRVASGRGYMTPSGRIAYVRPVNGAWEVHTPREDGATTVLLRTHYLKAAARAAHLWSAR